MLCLLWVRDGEITEADHGTAMSRLPQYRTEALPLAGEPQGDSSFQFTPTLIGCGGVGGVVTHWATVVSFWRSAVGDCNR